MSIVAVPLHREDGWLPRVEPPWHYTMVPREGHPMPTDAVEQAGSIHGDPLGRARGAGRLQPGFITRDRGTSGARRHALGTALANPTGNVGCPLPNQVANLDRARHVAPVPEIH